MRKGRHSEIITFNVVPIGKHAIIIGMPWFEVHDPTMKWARHKVSFDSEYCQENCLQHRDTEELEIMEVAAVSEEDKQIIPEELHDLEKGFDIALARTMPETRGTFNFTIKLKEGEPLPPRSRPYRLTPDQMEEAKRQIEELESSGMISKSQSPMAAPLFFVGKKDGGQRMCIDYQKLNDITVRDAYPLPNMEALLEDARGSSVFSKFDLRSAYNMIPIEPEDRWKTGFVTPWGLYKFNVMHFGFANAPACLQ